MKNMWQVNMMMDMDMKNLKTGIINYWYIY